jgi:hypothetical protein
MTVNILFSTRKGNVVPTKTKDTLKTDYGQIKDRESRKRRCVPLRIVDTIKMQNSKIFVGVPKRSPKE